MALGAAAARFAAAQGRRDNSDSGERCGMGRWRGKRGRGTASGKRRRKDGTTIEVGCRDGENFWEGIRV